MRWMGRRWHDFSGFKPEVRERFGECKHEVLDTLGIQTEAISSYRTEVGCKLIEVSANLEEAKAASEAATHLLATPMDAFGSRLEALAKELSSFRLAVGTRLDAVTSGRQARLRNG